MSQSVQYYKPHILPDIVISAGLISLTIFSEDVPIELKLAVSTIIGRVLIFVAVVALIMWRGPLIGLVCALAAVALYNSSLNARNQGFADYQYRKYNDKNRWFVEKVLNETPKAVEFEKVETLPAN
jgi:hypothetical protein